MLLVKLTPTKKNKEVIFLTVYDALSSKEACLVGALLRGAACGCDESVDACVRLGGGGADRLVVVALLLNPDGIDGAGLDGRLLPFSDVGVDGSSEIIDALSTFESSEWTLTFESSGCKGFFRVSSAKTKAFMKITCVGKNKSKNGEGMTTF